MHDAKGHAVQHLQLFNLKITAPDSSDNVKSDKSNS